MCHVEGAWVRRLVRTCRTGSRPAAPPPSRSPGRSGPRCAAGGRPAARSGPGSTPSPTPRQQGRSRRPCSGLLAGTCPRAHRDGRRFDFPLGPAFHASVDPEDARTCWHVDAREILVVVSGLYYLVCVGENVAIIRYDEALRAKVENRNPSALVLELCRPPEES